MKKIILVPDSFKGTMRAEEVCDIMREVMSRHYPTAKIVSLPVADGGEGTVDCFLRAAGGTKEAVTVKNPLFEDMQGFYGLIDGGRTAIVETAVCAGLPLIEDRKDPLRATTFGVGQLIVEAASRGVEKIVVGLGGSATNDGGCGAACAAGVRFLNGAGESFIPTGGTLCAIARIDMTGRVKAVGDVKIVAVCDVTNPMCGPQGASYVYGPQKGASPETVRLLDEGLRHLSECIKRDLGADCLDCPGSGAAGAMGAGMCAFFGAELEMGIETVLDALNFDSELEDADLVLTGEGKLDEQSLRGKAVIGAARRAKRKGVPTIAVVGDIGDGAQRAYDEGLSYIVSINRTAVDFSAARVRAKEDLALTVDDLARFLKSMGF
ncbi:MAG: glycerate kinase [Clostridiales Family XIII bacterium]|jgi:glycerate kinase|nr:glycerate kinase [Clostridiales Family XIII bacterium]